MSLAGPPPPTRNPARRLFDDLRAERRASVPFPPGEHGLSLSRTRRMASDPLSLLLESYERYGPVFTLRIFHAKSVFMLGPEANHFMTVSGAENFCWREGSMGDLIPLLGDGLLTIDGEFHRRSRRIMLPAFHRERIAESIDVMREETTRALAGWADGARIDVYRWTRRLAMRIAMRALFGLDPDSAGAAGVDAADLFERALRLYSRDYFLQVMRGPGTPFSAMVRARAQLDALIHGEINRRRRTGERGGDILSLLLDASDEEGEGLSDAHIRDEVMTLLFAGHDTTTSTVAFLLYELARHPEALAAVQAERDTLGRAPLAPELMSGALPELDMALDETLRLYPPAWIGPRRSVRTFEFAGVTIPAGVPVNYCSWASHHLSHVFEDPERFWPERFCAERRSALAKGAYVPFGGGSRICIGMRFGQLEVRVIAGMILERFGLDVAPDYRLSIRQMPTIGPRAGMPLIVHRRHDAPTVGMVAAA